MPEKEYFYLNLKLDAVLKNIADKPSFRKVNTVQILS